MSCSGLSNSVLHLNNIEHTTSQGVDREELIEWYLEQKEHELESVEDLEQEREIIVKAIAKLVKDKYLMELRGAVSDSLGDESMGTSADSSQVHYVVRKSIAWGVSLRIKSHSFCLVARPRDRPIQPVILVCALKPVCYLFDQSSRTFRSWLFDCMQDDLLI